MNATEKAERNREIVRQKALGRSATAIANEFGIDDSTVRRIWYEFCQQEHTLREHDPIEIVDQLLVELRGMAEQLGDIAYENAQKNHAANVIGAIRSRRDVLRDITELLQATGTLPRDLGTMHHVIDGRVMADQIVGVLERHDAPLEMVKDMLIALGADDIPELPAGVVDGSSVAVE